jgi:hypothetical protein
MNEYLTRPIVAATIPDGGDPIKFGSKCELRHEHQPQPRYLERHHIIPRAWQKFHRPRDEELQIAPAQEPDRDGIWYPETVFLCRTGHGNVHYWIERAMKLYVMLPPGPDHSERAMTAAREGQVARSGGPVGRPLRGKRRLRVTWALSTRRWRFSPPCGRSRGFRRFCVCTCRRSCTGVAVGAWRCASTSPSRRPMS